MPPSANVGLCMIMLFRVLLTVVSVLVGTLILDVPMPLVIRLGWDVLTTVVVRPGPRSIYVMVSRVTSRLRLLVTGCNFRMCFSMLLPTNWETTPVLFPALAVCEFLGGGRLGTHPLARMFRVIGDYMTRSTFSLLYAGIILVLTMWHNVEHRGRSSTSRMLSLPVSVRLVWTRLVAYLSMLTHRVPFRWMMLVNVRTALLNGALALQWRVRHRLMQLACSCPSDLPTDLRTRPCDRFTLPVFFGFAG